jgi:hypothetical protein
MPKTTTVSTSAALVATAKRASAGDTILLAPGNYGDVTLYAIRPGGTVTIKSADANNDAVFGSININASSNLVFEDIDVRRTLRPGEPEWARAVAVGGSNNISFVGVDFSGSMNGNRNDDGNGLVVTSSSRIAVLDSTFQQFNNAVVLGRLDDVIFAGNTIRDVREGVNMTQIRGGLFERNYLTEIIPDMSKGDHPDAFQLHAAGAATVSSDIVFRSNVMITNAQGIFINNHKLGQGLFQSNIVIENNYYEGNQRNAISVNGADNVVVTNNSLRAGNAGVYAPAVVVGGSTDVLVTNNIIPLTVQRADGMGSNVRFENNIDTWDPQRRTGVAIASVFAAPLASGEIDFASLNARGANGVDVTGIGFRTVAGIGNLTGSSAAMLASYVPQFDTHFSANFFA